MAVVITIRMAVSSPSSTTAVAEPSAPLGGSGGRRARSDRRAEHRT